MSGTSLDGVDAAVLETDGRSITGFGEFRYRPYSDAERSVLRAALGGWQGDPHIARAAEIVENAHAEVLADMMPADLIGFHGQTLAHDPQGKRTHQAGNGSVLAEALECPVVWDFRSSDVELGGEGAPLAPFYHHALARHINAPGPQVFLNLGGVGNLTWVDPSKESPDDEGACLAFDTGPANAPINDLVEARLGKSFDRGGALAARGRVAEDVSSSALQHSYYGRIPPKSLDRDAFDDLMPLVADLSDTDATATLTAIAAGAVASGLEHCPTQPTRILVTGGGRKNPVLMAMISAGTDLPVLPVEDVGLDGDMLEAQAFAFLAVRVIRGLTTTAPSTTGVAAAIGGGRISRPGGLTRVLAN